MGHHGDNDGTNTATTMGLNNICACNLLAMLLACM